VGGGGGGGKYTQWRSLVEVLRYNLEVRGFDSLT